MFKIFIFTFFLLLQSLHLHARHPYRATVIVDSTSATVSAPNLVDLRRELTTNAIEEVIPFYTPTSPAAIDFNIRGIIAIGAFAANSTSLVVSIPQAGITQTFTGATRDDSITLFKDFIHDGGTHHKLLKAYARFSPIDPIAGNPDSLMAQMAQQDYSIGHLSPLSGCDCSWRAQPIVHQFQAGTYAERSFCKQFETSTITFPLRYSYSPNLNWALILDAPLTLNINGGAYSLFGSLGLGVRVPITHNWSLTPNVRVGSGGSLDLCTAGSFVSSGITSVFNYKISEYVLSMTNFAGYYSSTNLWLTGVNFNYHLHNYVFKNGLSLTSCKGFTVLGKPLNFSLSFIDSEFAREHLFIKHFDEVGFSLITNYINPYIDYDCLSLGFSYRFGQKNYRGYYLNLAYQF